MKIWTRWPENPDIAGAVEGGHPQDFFAMFSDALAGAHLSIIVAPGRRLDAGL
jgi:hypothetical protein